MSNVHANVFVHVHVWVYVILWVRSKVFMFWDVLPIFRRSFINCMIFLIANVAAFLLLLSSIPKSFSGYSIFLKSELFALRCEMLELFRTFHYYRDDNWNTLVAYNLSDAGWASWDWKFFSFYVAKVDYSLPFCLLMFYANIYPVNKALLNFLDEIL